MKTKKQNDSDLEDYLHKEKKNIHMNQIKAYMENIP